MSLVDMLSPRGGKPSPPRKPSQPVPSVPLRPQPRPLDVESTQPWFALPEPDEGSHARTSAQMVVQRIIGLLLPLAGLLFSAAIITFFGWQVWSVWNA